VAVVSADAARQVWRGRSAIGQRLKWGGVDSEGPWVTIVGVAAVTRYRELADPRPAVYLPAAQFVDDANTLALRLSVPMETIAKDLRAHVRELDPEVWVMHTGPFAGYLARPLARPRFAAWLSNVFGAIALVLSAVGLYGVLAAFVRQSTREIGIRVALGATAGDVRALVIGEAARLLCVGALVGVFGAMATSGLLRGLVFAVRPFDPLTIAAAVAVLVAAAGVACSVPIRRATRLDPAALLRTE
jgi:predicted lysophospholipase L1 biosynthesis ABC-type transport system permease subunit